MIAVLPYTCLYRYLAWHSRPTPPAGSAITLQDREVEFATELGSTSIQRTFGLPEKLAREDGDPLAEKRRAQEVPSFAEAAVKVVEQQQAGWRNPKYPRAWLSSLERFAFTRIGKMPVTEVTGADIYEVLAPIWHVKPPTARTLRRRMRTVLEWAVAMELLPDNPCDRIGRVLGPQNDVVKQMKALPHREVAEALEPVRASGSLPVVKLAFEFLVLTAARWREVRWAVWPEMDRGEGVRTIPAKRMRAGRENRVPLCGRAVEILGEARKLDGGSSIVFARGRGRELAEKQVRQLLGRLGIAAVPHSFRSSFRDWAAEETDHPREVVAAALAQIVKNEVGGAYMRSYLFERRRRLMDEWAKYVGGRRAGTGTRLDAPQPPAGLRGRCRGHRGFCGEPTGR